MPSKRPFSEVDGAAAAEKEPRADSQAAAGPRKRKRVDKKSKGRTDSVNALKKRVRTIERRFKNGSTLPPDVTAELQRELATNKAMIVESTLKKKRSDMISKYHMVRFFERRKAERLVKQLKRKAEAAADADETETQRAQLHIADVDLAYTRNFPYLEPYVSLYPRDIQGAAAALGLERPPVWKEVEAAMAEGEEALELLRERNPEGGVVPVKLRQGGRPEDESPFQKGKDKKGKDKDGKGGKSGKDGKESKDKDRKEGKHEKKASGSAGRRDAEDGGDDGSDDGGFFED